VAVQDGQGRAKVTRAGSAQRITETDLPGEGGIASAQDNEGIPSGVGLPSVGAASHGPRESVRSDRLSSRARRRRGHREHEPQGRLLRQRSDGELLRHAEERAGLLPALVDEGRGSSRAVRVDRGQIQPPSPSLDARLLQSGGVRRESQSHIRPVSTESGSDHFQPAERSLCPST
jgi:hypothetical protein